MKTGIYLFQIFFILLLFVMNVHSYELPESFKSYKKIEIPYLPNINDKGHLYLDSSINTTDIKITERGYKIDGVMFKVLSNVFKVGCLSGPAENIEFKVNVIRSNDTLSKYITAEKLFISATGNIYSESTFGYLFKVKKKFIISEDSIIEVKQPYYSVNLDCYVNEMLVITSEKCSKDKVLARIPKGMQVHILLAENPDFYEGCNGGQNYLVRTSFGLVGWVNTTSKHAVYDKEPPQLDCLLDYGP